MPVDDNMTADERRKYLKRMAVRHAQADRLQRGALLSELEAVTGLHCKSLLQLLHAPSLEQPLLPTAQQLAQWEELVRTPAQEAQLAGISRTTEQRLLQRFQLDTPKLPRHKPEPQNRLLRNGPMERLPWAITVPGSFETDLVHHCGPVAAGLYIPYCCSENSVTPVTLSESEGSTSP